MSAKSIGYKAIALPDGTYSSAKITIDGDGQITKLESQTITPEGEELVEDYEALEAIVVETQGLQTATQVLLKSLETSLPAWNGIQTELISTVADLTSQYNILEAEYATITPRFTPTLILEKTPAELALPTIETAQDVLVDTFTLEAGTYTVFLSAIGTLDYTSGPAQPANPYNPPLQDLPDDSEWGVNTMCVSFLNPSNVVLGTIFSSEYSISGTTTTQTANKLVSIINGSTTFQLTAQQNVRMFIRWNNLNIAIYATNTTPLVFLAGDATTLNNVPVEQTGKSFSIWKVAE